MNRIVTILPPGGKIDLFKTKIRNFLETVENHAKPEKLLIMYDDSASSDVTDLHQDKDLKKFKIETLEIPAINNLFTESFPYKFENKDVILAPALQLHIPFLLNSFNSHIPLHGNKIFIFHTEPEGIKSTLSVLEYDNSTPRKLFFKKAPSIKRQGKDTLDNLIESSGGMWEADPVLRGDIDEFIKFESIVTNFSKINRYLTKFLPEKDQISSRPATSKERGDIFEQIVAILVKNQPSISECRFSVSWKNKHKLLAREEDTIALYDNLSDPQSPQLLIYISAKSSINTEELKKKTKIEIERMKVLKLPLNFPQERVRKILVVSSMASQAFKQQTPDLIVTNLAGLHDVISKL